MKSSLPTKNTPPPQPESHLPPGQTPPRGEIFDDSDLKNGTDWLNMTKNPKANWLLTGIAGAFLLISLGAYIQGKSKRPAPIGPFVTTDTVRPPIKVEVAGEVKNPGVYNLPGGSRVQDALMAAGGPLTDADTSGLKLADWAADGSKINVPAVGAAPTVEPPPSVQGAALVPAPALAPAPPLAAPDTVAPAKSSDVYLDYLKKNPVDINHASAAQIEVLPDLGPKMAERVVAYRDAHGPFKSVDELDNVKGIGAKRIDGLRGLVIVR